MDGTDAACVHLVVYDEDNPAATGRIRVTRSEFLIGRVAVMPDKRKTGLGTLVMRMLIRACCAMGGERQVLHAQLTARGFYEKLGFTAYGGVFDDTGIPHIAMEHLGDCENPCERR